MKKQLQTPIVYLFYFMLLFSTGALAQNVFSGEPVQWVGRPNGYSTTPYGSDYRTTIYRKVSTTTSNPTDGRGQWTTTINVQSSGGDITPDNMPGGGGAGWLLISGPSGNRFQNKWNFNGVGQGALNAVNSIVKQGGGQDMGLNMGTSGRYTFNMRDAGYTNTEFYVGYTANAPVTVSKTGQSYSGTQPVITISTNAAPSSGENIYVRYRVGTNDFSASTSVVQATGSGTSWTATLPSQSCGTTLYYYVYTSTRTLAQINSDSESDRSLATLRYDDSFGANFSISLPAATTYYQDLDADGFGNPNVTQLSCTGTPAGYVTNNSDCNDSVTYYTDADGDGFGVLPKLACGSVTNNTDCDDARVTYSDIDGDGFGALPKVACGVLNNSDCNDNQFQYLDADGDGFGSTTKVACGVTNNTDCNDSQLQYLDSDGDGFGSNTLVACGVTNNTDCNDNQFQYLDADGDGFGSTTKVACGVTNNTDCNDSQLQYLDADGDGFGSNTLVACGVTNNTDCNDSQLQYLDADGDGFGSNALVACGVSNHNDCNDSQLQYLDADGDGFGSNTLVACGVSNHDDCNDSQLQYLDADGDGFGSTTKVACGVTNNTDCNDSQLQYTDADGDGFGVLPLVACGVANQSDCNDSQLRYLDADGDGFGSTTLVACGGVTNNTDCNDNSNTAWQTGTFYADGDGDGYSATPGVTQVICYGASGVGGFSLALHTEVDCNDANNAIHPGATEICYNNILENCTGTLSQGCAPVVVNMTPSYNNTTLPSLSTAIPAVAYTYPGATNLKYRFRITNVTTNTTAADIIQTSRYVTIPASIHSYNAQYSITVSAVINDEVVAFAGNTITLNSPTVQLVTLNSATCGATLAALTSTLTANPGLNATGYTFRIRLNDTNPSPTYAYSQSSTRFISANSFTGFPLQYSTSYKVAVQFTFNDPVTNLPVQSGYGSECTVNTPSIPVTTMASPTCGSQVTAMNANISATAASYATGYQFRIRLFADNSTTPAYNTSVANASRFSSLTAFTGQGPLTLAYNTEYAVSVRYSILNGSTTVWSDWGPDCKVKTPFFPVTSLVPSQCGLTTATSLTQQLNITPYPGFPNYRVKLDEVSGEDIVNSQEIVVTYPYFRLNQFSIAQEGKNYNVSVAIKLNGEFGPYDTACDLFTSSNGNGNNEGGSIVKAIMPFKATAYPNPFANNFMLDVKSSSQSNVSIKVYDMIGRMIEQKEVRVSDMETTTIGDQYPSGVYNVVVSQEDSVETVRVVKR